MSENRGVTRRRNRIITSCLECRKRKLKCDRLHPCNHCIKGPRDCVFLAPALDPASKGKLNKFKQSMESLERDLEKEVQSGCLPGWRANASGVEPSANSPISAEFSVPEDERDLEPTPLALVDIAYGDEDYDKDDDTSDLGVQFGRMRITERIGGFARPRMAEEFAEVVRMLPQDLGRSKVIQRASISPQPMPTSSMPLPYLEPSTSYVAPATGLLFSGMSPEDSSVIDFLPPRNLADTLLEQYWKSVHPIVHILHQPTFQRQYASFWQSIAANFEPSQPHQALVFAALFSAAISLPDNFRSEESGLERKEIVNLLQAGCEQALSRSNLLHASKIDVLQAFVVYLTPMCRAEVSRSHCALISTAIRLATMAGLHRDGTIYGMSPVDVHVRRLIWYHLCFLDIRSSEAMGPPLQIRSEEFDTKLPLNVDDADLENLVVPERGLSRWTDATFSRIKFECVEHRRRLFIEQKRLLKKETTVTALLRHIEDFRENVEARYLPIIDELVPVQALAKRIIRVFIYKAHTLVLNRYVLFAPQNLPNRLRDIIWASGAALLEISVELDTAPRFGDWSWYNGAWHQYHVALLFLAEVSLFPQRREVDRIWNCLDYVFDAPQYLTRNEKINYVISTAMSRLEALPKQRKTMLPLDLQQKLGSSEDNSKRSRPPPANLSIKLRKESDVLSNWSFGSGKTPDNSVPINATNKGSALPPDTPNLKSNVTKSDNSENEDVLSNLSPNPAQSLNTLGNLALSFLPTSSPAIDSAQLTNDGELHESMDFDWDELDRLFPPEVPPDHASPFVGDETTAAGSVDFTMPLFTPYPAPSWS